MIPRLYGIGFTFDPSHSSCGRRKPAHFEWTADARDENMGCAVCIGSEILPGITLSTRLRKIAWFIESREIHRRLFDAIVEGPSAVQQEFEFFFTCDRELAGELANAILIPAGSNLPWATPVDPRTVTKSRICSMFCSRKRATAGHEMRHELAGKFREHLDLFGGAWGSPRLGNGSHPSKSGALDDYMFHVAVENASYGDYYTEKITDCFITGTVPIYYGSPNIGETFNPQGIVTLTEDFDPRQLTSDHYESKREAIIDNFERALTIVSADDELFLHLADAL